MRLPQNLFDGDISVQVILCQPDKTRIGEILPYDKKGTLKFNSYSEISLTIDRHYNDLITGETKINPYYELIESPRIIELRGIGHFVIQDGDENIGDSETKSITAFSLEHSTGQKYLENFYINTGEEGSVETMYHAQTHGAEYAIDVYYEKATKWDKFERYYKKEYTNTNAYNYVEEQVLDENDFAKYKGGNSEDTLYVKAYPNVRFYWPTKPELSLLHLVIAHIPEWKIGHVDKELWFEERTFSEDRVAVYDFLYNNAAPTFKFVMVWDTVGDENTVSFYKAEEDGIITQLTPASTYIDGIIYFNEDGSEANPQPKNNDEVLFGNYFVKYDAIETQWDTDVFISKDNLASQIDISYSADDIKTKLKVVGADTLDVRDVNLGQNYILNLSYYNDDLWMGKDLHAKYDQYTTYLAEKTDEYSKLVSKWSSAYNEYSDLMNNVPVNPSVLLIGDKFDKLYCTYGLIKATNYVENKTYYDMNGNTATPTYDKDKKITSDHYINTAVDLLPELKKKLGLYRVGVDDKGKISAIDKTDDVLLTLENNLGNSVTIRVKCETTASKYEDYDYKIYRTLTTASSGLSETTEYSVNEWVKGALTAKVLGLVDGQDRPNFTVKSIGTLGAYLCLSKDETKKENIEEYGIKLLEEKQDVYTKIFITQTEGYISKEGARCVAMDADKDGNGPEGASIGDKWLVTNSDNAEVKEWDGTKWIPHSVNTVESQNSADFENYTRFLDNYEKLQVVQEVLSEKQRIADYLLNGIKMNDIYLTFDDKNDASYYLSGLLRAAIMHHMTLNNYVISVSEPSVEYQKEGMVWFQYDEYTSHISVYKYDGQKWIPQTGDNSGFDFNAILTDYFLDEEKSYAYLVYIFDPSYKKAEKFSDNYTYFIAGEREVNGITYATYNKFYAQPNNDSDVNYTYEGVISDGVTIAKDTVCYFTINNKQYIFTTPQDLNKNSILLCNLDTKKLTVGITSLELTEYLGEENEYEIYQKQIADYANEYNNLVNGNVDYAKRPLISDEEMQKVYPDFPDGDTATTYSQYWTVGLEDNLYTIDITPIHENGTILSQQELDEYIWNLNTDDKDSILESDTDNLIIHIHEGTYEDNAEYWDTLQEQLGVIKNNHLDAIQELHEIMVNDTANLSFSKVNYYIAEGLEYAVYTTNGTPYVSYSHSQGMCLAQMNYIKELTDMNNYFNEAERMRLSPFIREDEYSDDNFLLTGYESEAEQMDIKKSLLKAGTEELAKICKPRLSFNATMANLLAIPEFAPLRWQFKLGNFVSVGLREPYNISANVKKTRLLEVQINFEDDSDFSATFGDLESTKSLVDKHADLLSQAVTVAQQVATHASNWQRGANKATALDQAINDGLKDAALSIGAADGQAIIWDRYGIRGRKLKDGTTDQYDDRQFALINNKLVFTDDNWATSRAAVGEFEVEIKGVKQNMYGMLADAIVGGYIQGTEIVGGRLEIGGDKGKFVVEEDGSVSIKTANDQELYAQQSAITAIDSAYKYSIHIIHTDKAVFSTKNDTATLTAKIYRRGVEVTTIFKQENITVSWDKNPSDADWVPSKYVDGEGTYAIILNSNDVQNSAQISCHIDIDDIKMQEIENKYFKEEE